MEKVCCGILEKLYETYKLPFYQPIILNKNHDLVTGGWTARLFTLTPGGSISEKCAPSIRLTFCPFCGVSLVAETKGEENAKQD